MHLASSACTKARPPRMVMHTAPTRPRAQLCDRKRRVGRSCFGCRAGARAPSQRRRAPAWHEAGRLASSARVMARPPLGINTAAVLLDPAAANPDPPRTTSPISGQLKKGI